MTPEELFNAALAKVESKSIKAWADEPNNRAAFIKYAATPILENDKPDPVNRLVIVIVSQAVGL